MLTLVHGPSIWRDKAQFWSTLKATAETFDGAWICLGDFNSLADHSDKWGAKLLWNLLTVIWGLLCGIMDLWTLVFKVPHLHGVIRETVEPSFESVSTVVLPMETGDFSYHVPRSSIVLVLLWIMLLFFWILMENNGDPQNLFVLKHSGLDIKIAELWWNKLGLSMDRDHQLTAFAKKFKL
ncbi:hypothetical protein CJ030_MR5G023716 [Morella rubra]|uniref:Endonuclease/exonuclease/phosphatase domain-containing protein n=1 Tax=Morella rubra TaxID=262757 RepID=A0A6A1VJG4_9ROSI|nr:hypothetical protein CJ030_MR5G023716 [Morella rubra]